jgi:hypothetical protein
MGTPKYFDVFGAEQHQAENAYQEIRVKQGILERVRTSVRRRAESCVEIQGNHRRASSIEITPTSPVSQQALVFGHVLTGLFCSFK